MTVNEIRIELPYHLRTLARIHGEVRLFLNGEVTIGSIIDELERVYPMLKGTLRDHGKRERRPMIRFFACQEDWSNEPVHKPLPDAIVNGQEAFLIIGAIAGG
jgi:sulfur-carrier protein